jgi:hypothetical protein
MMAAPMTKANHVEASRMIEDVLFEMLPCLERSKVKMIAHKLASLQGFQPLDAGAGSKCLKLRLKKICRDLLADSKQRRHAAAHGNSTKKEQSKAKAKMLGLADCQAKADRHHLLINTVGDEKYDEIMTVTKEIKEIRQISAVWTKFSQNGLHSSEEQAPASKSLPAPIADIYFRTRLIDVMRIVDAKRCIPLDEISEPSGCLVQQSNWDWLLEDAKMKLARFRRFEMEQVTEDDHLTFSCNSGFCSLPKALTTK